MGRGFSFPLADAGHTVQLFGIQLAGGISLRSYAITRSSRFSHGLTSLASSSLRTEISSGLFSVRAPPKSRAWG